MSTMAANESQLNNKRRRLMKACDVSRINMKSEVEGLLISETECSRENNLGVSSKRRPISRETERLCYNTLDTKEIEQSGRDNSGVDYDEEDSEVLRDKWVARRARKEIKGKKFHSLSPSVEKSQSLKTSTVKPIAKKLRTEGPRGRSAYTEPGIISTCSKTSSGDSGSHGSSSTLTSCSPTSATIFYGDSTAKSTTNAPEKGKKHFMCHQCKKNDRPAVVKCLKCKDKLYCVRCIRQWYPQFDEVDIAQACPFCQSICNCNECLHSSGIVKTSKRDIPPQEKIGHLKYLVSSLLPFVRQIRHEQIQEIKIEAKIQGISLQEDNIPGTSCSDDERIFCNQCATSIFDLHRSCPRCSYELCLVCSKEIREGNLLGGPEKDLYTYSYKGFDYVHGGDPLPYSSIDNSNNVCHSHCEWIANSDGSIPCPSKDRGGCGSGILELMRIFPKGWLSSLEKKAVSLMEDNNIKQKPGTTPSDMLCKAASRRNSVDNDLYCPSSNDLLRDDTVKTFQQHWANGEPIIVRDSLQQAPGLSWEPMVMWRALCENADSNITGVDCLANCEKKISK